MEWLRQWILAIAGTIIIGSLCDIVVPEGSIRKYVRLVTGLMLTLAVISPFANVSVDELENFEERQTRRRAVEFQNSLGERERFDVIRIYRSKLCDSIKKEIQITEDENIEIKIEVEEDDEKRFGEIKEVSVIINDNNGHNGRYQDIKNKIQKKYEVDEDNIRIIVLSTR